MFWLLFSIALLTIFAGFYRLRLYLYSIILITIEILFFQFGKIETLEFSIFFILTVLVLSFLNFRNIRRRFITKPFCNYLLQSDNNWKSFSRIDDGWFASEFEKKIFRGEVDFGFASIDFSKNKSQNTDLSEKIQHYFLNKKTSSQISVVNNLIALGAGSLQIPASYNGQDLSIKDISILLKNISKYDSVLAAIIGLLNLDSLSSLINNFANSKQKQKFLPQFAKGNLTPYLKPTSLYESIDSQKSSIEGRIEKKFIDGEQVLGVRVSFKDLILLGTSKSNCFFINVNIKDFNNIYSQKTHLGTAICIINDEIKGLQYQKGLKSYDDYLSYYACTGNDIFIPFENIVNETSGIGKGLEYLYKNQCYACNIWPLGVSIPINKTLTLTSWYFAHIQKQNGRQLLSYKIVLAKLKEQFSQCLKLQILDNISMQQGLSSQPYRFTAILNKSLNINQTMKQLTLLREILGSNSHNIKTESRVRTFYKVAHLATELDGMSHEINQLPLIKKAALACHPYYDKEVQLLTDKKNFDLVQFDKLAFQHIGYILQNLIKLWLYSFRTSFFVRLLFPKNKYKNMIKRMSASFTFLSDIILINWTFKKKINTSFAGQLGRSIQELSTLVTIYSCYKQPVFNNSAAKDLIKFSIKNGLYNTQKSLNDSINLAFDRFPGLLIKAMLFPLGKPFHYSSGNQPIDNEIESICKLENSNNEYEHSQFLQKIYDAKQKLKIAESAEIAVTNVTGTPVTTDNYETLINRCLAAGIVSIEQSEQLRDAYQSILDIQLTNHFGNNYEKKKHEE